jgi:hypothetical protein
MNQVAFHFAPALHRPADGREPVRAGAASTAVAAVEDVTARETGVPTVQAPADPGDALGFDHARYGLMPPADCLWPGHPVREGWERGRRLVGRRTRPASLAVQRWLALRLRAWREGTPFDDVQLTPSTLRALETTTRCPVTGVRLDDGAAVLRLDPSRGWVAGNLALVAAPVAERLDTMSWAAAKAALEAAERAAEADASGTPSMQDAGALTLRQWRRAVALKSLATPLPEGEARVQAMRVLPPNRVRLVNPIQGVQALLSLQLATPGWGTRTSRLAASVPLLLRCEFHLFFHTLLAHTLRAGQDVATVDGDRSGLRAAVERAWSEPVVQRRWERFARHIDDGLAQLLVERLAGEPLPGMQLLQHGEGLVLGQ